MQSKDMRTLTRSPNYRINLEWERLQDAIYRYTNVYKFDMNPDFQRGHVWTKEQQVKYVEFVLSGGESSKDIYCNCPGWMGDSGQMVLVDGKQRITAALKYINNEIKAFGLYRFEINKRLPSWAEFIWHVNDLPHKHQVLTWYLEMNSGGTPHTQEELDSVRKLLCEEKNKA